MMLLVMLVIELMLMMVIVMIVMRMIFKKDAEGAHEKLTMLLNTDDFDLKVLRCLVVFCK